MKNYICLPHRYRELPEKQTSIQMEQKKKVNCPRDIREKINGKCCNYPQDCTDYNCTPGQLREFLTELIFQRTSEISLSIKADKLWHMESYQENKTISIANSTNYKGAYFI